MGLFAQWAKNEGTRGAVAHAPGSTNPDGGDGHTTALALQSLEDPYSCVTRLSARVAVSHGVAVPFVVLTLRV